MKIFKKRKGHKNLGEEYTSKNETIQEPENNPQWYTRIISYKAKVK